MQSQHSTREFYPFKYEDFETLLAQAYAKLYNQQYASAITAFDSIIENPAYVNLPEVYLGRARAHYELKSYAQTVADCYFVSTLCPHNIAMHSLMAQALDKTGDKVRFKVALEDVRKMRAALTSTRQWYYRVLAAGLRENPKTKDLSATIHTDRATCQSSECFHYAHLAFQDEKYDLAQYWFEKACHIFPHDFISLFHLTNMHYMYAMNLTEGSVARQHSLAESLAQMDYLIANYNYSRVFALRGSFYFQQQNFTLALPDFCHAVIRYEADDFAHFTSKRKQIFTTLNKGNKKTFHESLSFEKNKMSSDVVISFLNEADKCFNQQEYADALLYYSLAIWHEDKAPLKNATKLAQLYIMRAHVYMIQDNIIQANYNFTLAQDYLVSPELLLPICTLSSMYRLGKHLLFRNSSLPKTKANNLLEYFYLTAAIETFLATDFGEIGCQLATTAIKLMPELPEAYRLRAKYYENEKDYAQAIIDNDKAIALCPYHMTALHMRMTMHKLHKSATITAAEYTRIWHADKVQLAQAYDRHLEFWQWYGRLLLEKTSTREDDNFAPVLYGIEALKNNNFIAANYYFTIALHTNEDNFIAQAHQGIGAFKQGAIAKARVDLRHCIKRYAYPRADFGMALIEYKKSNLNAAQQHMQRALQHASLADIDFFAVDETIVMACLTGCKSFSTTQFVDYFIAGLMHWKNQQWQKAKTNFTAAIWLQAGATFKAYFYRSYTNVRLGLLEAAAKDVEHALENANRNRVKSEEMVILKKTFVDLCIETAAGMVDQVVNKLAYLNLALRYFPGPALYVARAAVHLENGATAEASQDLLMKDQLASDAQALTPTVHLLEEIIADKLPPVLELAEHKEILPAVAEKISGKQKKKKLKLHKKKTHKKPEIPSQLEIANPPAIELSTVPTPFADSTYITTLSADSKANTVASPLQTKTPVTPPPQPAKKSRRQPRRVISYKESAASSDVVSVSPKHRAGAETTTPVVAAFTELPVATVTPSAEVISAVSPCAAAPLVAINAAAMALADTGAITDDLSAAPETAAAVDYAHGSEEINANFETARPKTLRDLLTWVNRPPAIVASNTPATPENPLVLTKALARDSLSNLPQDNTAIKIIAPPVLELQVPITVDLGLAALSQDKAQGSPMAQAVPLPLPITQDDATASLKAVGVHEEQHASVLETIASTSQMIPSLPFTLDEPDFNANDRMLSLPLSEPLVLPPAGAVNVPMTAESDVAVAFNTALASDRISAQGSQVSSGWSAVVLSPAMATISATLQDKLPLDDEAYSVTLSHSPFTNNKTTPTISVSSLTNSISCLSLNDSDTENEEGFFSHSNSPRMAGQEPESDKERDEEMASKSNPPRRLPALRLRRATTATTDNDQDEYPAPSPQSRTSSLSSSSLSVTSLTDKVLASSVVTSESSLGYAKLVRQTEAPLENRHVAAAPLQNTLNTASSNYTFFTQPLPFNMDYILRYLPTTYQLYDIESTFVAKVAGIEKYLNQTLPSHEPRLQYETYFVGGSLTDRVLKCLKDNLSAIPQPSPKLIEYLSRPMFQRELVVDDIDMVTTLPLYFVKQIAFELGWNALPVRQPRATDQEGYAPKIDFITFTKDAVKIDVVYKPQIDFAQEARERDTGLFLDSTGNLLDISNRGLMDLIHGKVRLTLERTDEYVIEPLKLMHAIQSASKRKMHIHDREALKLRPILNVPIQCSYLNSALRKLFASQRLVENYYHLRDFNLFGFVYPAMMNLPIWQDDAWVREQLLQSERQARPSLQHIHGIFITSYVMQGIIGVLIAAPEKLFTLETQLDFTLPIAGLLQECFAVIQNEPLFQDAYAQANPNMVKYIFENYLQHWKNSHPEELNILLQAGENYLLQCQLAAARRANRQHSEHQQRFHFNQDYQDPTPLPTGPVLPPATPSLRQHNRRKYG